MSEEKGKEVKTYRVVLSETINFGEAAVPSSVTIRSAIVATGSLGEYSQYYSEAYKISQNASMAGTISPNEISMLQDTLDKWRELSEDYRKTIVDLTKRDESKKILGVTEEINQRVSEQQKTLQTILETMSAGTAAWKIIEGFFDLNSSEKEETVRFKKMPHSDLLVFILKWIEGKNKNKKAFGEIIHGPQEAGIDIVLTIASKN